MAPIRLHYSERLIRDAVRAYWWKQIGPKFVIATVLMSIYLVYRLVSGDRGWIVGVVGAVLVLAFGIMAATYFVHLRRSLSRLRRMKVPEGTLEIAEERFKVTSDVGASEIEWSLISGIWRFKKVWLLFFSAGEFMTLPIADISPDSRSFILKKAEAYGAKIT